MHCLVPFIHIYLHVGQIQMPVYIYKAEKPSICRFAMPITCVGLLVSTHQVPNMKRSSSTYSKFVTVSS